MAWPRPGQCRCGAHHGRKAGLGGGTWPWCTGAQVSPPRSQAALTCPRRTATGCKRVEHRRQSFLHMICLPMAVPTAGRPPAERSLAAQPHRHAAPRLPAHKAAAACELRACFGK